MSEFDQNFDALSGLLDGKPSLGVPLPASSPYGIDPQAYSQNTSASFSLSGGIDQNELNRLTGGIHGGNGMKRDLSFGDNNNSNNSFDFQASVVDGSNANKFEYVNNKNRFAKGATTDYDNQQSFYSDDGSHNNGGKIGGRDMYKIPTNNNQMQYNNIPNGMNGGRGRGSYDDYGGRGGGRINYDGHGYGGGRNSPRGGGGGGGGGNYSQHHARSNSGGNYGHGRYDGQDMIDPYGRSGGAHGNKYDTSTDYDELGQDIAGTYTDDAGEFSQQQLSGFVYMVHFKRSHRYFLVTPDLENTVTRGSFVIVEADRGEDLGIVGDLVPAERFWAIRFTAISKKMLKNILRIASREEVQLLITKTDDEVIVTQICQEILLTTHPLPIDIVDAEYQFDRNKLTIYHDSRKRNDFRGYVRDLFCVFKTRIWMQQVDTQSESYPVSTSMKIANFNALNHINGQFLLRASDSEVSPVLGNTFDAPVLSSDLASAVAQFDTNPLAPSVASQKLSAVSSSNDLSGTVFGNGNRSFTDLSAISSKSPDLQDQRYFESDREIVIESVSASANIDQLVDIANDLGAEPKNLSQLDAMTADAAPFIPGAAGASVVLPGESDVISTLPTSESTQQSIPSPQNTTDNEDLSLELRDIIKERELLRLEKVEILELREKLREEEKHLLDLKRSIENEQ